MKKIWMALGFAGAMGVGLPAHALVSASVEIEAPEITVVDLDVDDGIEPDWISGGYAAPVFHFELRPAPVASEVYGDGRLLAGPQTTVGGSAAAPASGFLALTDLYMPGFTVSVTPYSRVTVSFAYVLNASLDGLAGAAGTLPNALASAELSLLAINNLRRDPDSGELLYDELPFLRDFASLDTVSGRELRGASRQEGRLQVSFDNASAGDAVFAFRAELVAFGNTAAAATVPEPATWALWLGGCLLLGLARRRRS